MPTCTWTELRDVMETSAGAPDDIAPFDDANLEATFDDLGYDSLAVLETASEFQRRYHIELPDEVVGEAETPQALLDVINGQLD